MRLFQTSPRLLDHGSQLCDSNSVSSSAVNLMSTAAVVFSGLSLFQEKLLACSERRRSKQQEMPLLRICVMNSNSCKMKLFQRSPRLLDHGLHVCDSV